MRVIIYDNDPGPGFMNWFLRLSWAVGAWLQKLFGKTDKVYGAPSWEHALAWLDVQPGPLKALHYWGHGSPGYVWLAQKTPDLPVFMKKLAPKVNADTEVWFRVCHLFHGKKGQDFARELAHGLGCTVAGHTRLIGLFHSGLHTLKPGMTPTWNPLEGDGLPGIATSLGLRWWENNTIICFRSTIPPGW